MDGLKYMSALTGVASMHWAALGTNMTHWCRGHVNPGIKVNVRSIALAVHAVSSGGREYSSTSRDFSPVWIQSNTLEYINPVFHLYVPSSIDSVNCNHTHAKYCPHHVQLSNTQKEKGKGENSHTQMDFQEACMHATEKRKLNVCSAQVTHPDPAMPHDTSSNQLSARLTQNSWQCPCLTMASTWSACQSHEK